MNKKAKILLFCMIFVARGAFCQITPGKPAFPAILFSPKPLSQNGYKFDTRTYFVKKKDNLISKINTINTVTLLTPASYSVINAAYFTHNFGFFCKKELQLEKVTKVPFKFRLGSVQYCDWMEGKKAAGILPNN